MCRIQIGLEFTVHRVVRKPSETTRRLLRAAVRLQLLTRKVGMSSVNKGNDFV